MITDGYMHTFGRMEGQRTAKYRPVLQVSDAVGILPGLPDRRAFKSLLFVERDELAFVPA